MISNKVCISEFFKNFLVVSIYKHKSVQPVQLFTFIFQFEKNPLQRLCASNDNINRLIVNLFPADNGYSLMIKTSSKQYTESLQLPYDESDILQYIDNEQVCSCFLNERLLYLNDVESKMRDGAQKSPLLLSFMKV